MSHITINMYNIIITIILIFDISVFSSTYLTDTIRGYFPEDEYHIYNNCYIPRGDSVIFDSGSVLKFSLFSGLTIYGTLMCLGTKNKPVLFQSLPDIIPPPQSISNENSADAFGWNGIRAEEFANAVTLNHTIVSDATFALNILSEKTDVSLNEVLFFNNGYSNFTINNNMIPIQENTPISGRWGFYNKIILYKGKDSSNTQVKSYKPQNNKSASFIIRLGVGAAALAGGILYFFGHQYAEKYNKEYIPETDKVSVELLRKKREKGVTIRNYGIVIGSIGAACFGLTLFFK